MYAKPNPNSTKATVTYTLMGATALGAAGLGAAASTVPQERPILVEKGSAGEPMTVTQAELDAKLDAAEARTETKFAQLLGEIKLLGQQLSGVQKQIGDLDTKVGVVDAHARSSKGIIITTIIAAAIGIVGLTYAVASLVIGSMSASTSAFQTGVAAGQQQSAPK